MESSKFQKMLYEIEENEHAKMVIFQTVNTHKFQAPSFDFDSALLAVIQADVKLSKHYKDSALRAYENRLAGF